jgi:branched-chain amino acid transport system substrate-binding protein
MRSRTTRSVATIMAAGLIFAACGGSDDAAEETDTTEAAEAAEETEESEEAPEETEAAEETDTTEAAEEASEAGGAALATEGSVEIAAGTILNLDECPDDWSPTEGADGDEIGIGMSLPQSGTLASFGAIGDGMSMYFDYVNDTDPIDGKNLVAILSDDAYEAGRTVANVEEMVDSGDVFAFSHIIGTPNNVAARPITDEACVPQLFNSSGFPLWGDPANFPWTVGNILNYATETNIWCNDIVASFGEGATVAALIMNNDFGTTYLNTLKESEACSSIEIVSEQLHDPAAPDITNEMTTLVGTGADVLISGTTGAFCPQVAASLAASEWRPTFYNSYTCNNLSSFYAPVADQIAVLGDSAPILANSNKVCGDPAYADDPAILLTEQVLNDFGDGTTCADGSFSTGVLYGQFVETIVRSAAAMEGGLNRVNLMAAMWNADTTNDNLLGGTLKLDGVNDAYWTEAAQLQIIVAGDDGSLSFSGTGEVADFEGQSGSYEG